MTTRIVIFENEEAFVEELEKGFADYNVELEVFFAGEKDTGFERAAAFPPDLVMIVQNFAPTVNGFSIFKDLKKNAALKEVPCIMLSASPDANEIFAAHRKLHLRADDYIKKPVSFDVVKEKIAQLVEITLADDPIVVDAEIEAFADDAFGSLMVEEEHEIEATEVVSIEEIEVQASKVPPPPPPPPPSDTSDLAAAGLEDFAEVLEPVEEGTVVSPPPLAAPPASIPPPSMARNKAISAPPPLSVAPVSSASTSVSAETAAVQAEELVAKEAELTAKEAELVATQNQVAELTSQLQATSAFEEQAKEFEKRVSELERELATAKANEGKSGGSSAEYLDLLERLNNKEKEVYELKEGSAEKIRDLENQLSAKGKEVVDLRDTNLGVERRKVAAENLASEQQSRAEVAEARVAELEQETADKGSAITALEGERDASKAKNSELEAEVAELKKTAQKTAESHADAFATERASNAAKLQDLKESFASEKSIFESAIVELTSTSETLSATKSELETKVSELEGKKAELEANIESLEASVSSLEEEKAGLTTKSGELSSEIEGLTSEKEALTTERDSLKDSLAELEGKHEALGTEKDELVANLETKTKELEEAVVAHEATKESHGRELALLGRKLASAESETEAKVTEIGALEREIGAYQKKIEQDKEVLGRARQAAAIAVALLDDQTKIEVEDATGEEIEVTVE